MNVINIPYGNTFLEMPPDDVAEVLESRVEELAAAKSEDDIVRDALDSPIGSPTIEALAKGKKNAVIIISDHTRPVPSKHMIPFMLERLRKGNDSIDVTLLVATGVHRGTKKEELIEKLGEKIVREEKILIHDCDDESCLVSAGKLPSGTDLIINKLSLETDLLLAEGFIEPHFFAGFSGGRKSVLPGICSKATVLGNHCSKFIDSPFARAGILEKNPVHIDMAAAVQIVPLKFILNVIIDKDKKIIAAFSGHPIEAHKAGCELLQSYCRVRPEQKGDIVVTSNGGAPLDQNVYQAVKGLFTAEAAVREGGVIIICAECADGIGGEGFYRALKECESPSGLLGEIRKIPMEKTMPDQWQYQIMAKILEKHRVYFVTDPSLSQAIEDMKMEYAPTLGEALRRAKEYVKSRRIVVIPDGVAVVVENGGTETEA